MSNCARRLIGVIVLLGATAAFAQDASQDVKVLASLEEGNPFTTGEIIREFPSYRVWPIVKGEIVTEHATAGGKALKVSDGALVLRGPMDWRGYDFLKLDVFNSDSVAREIEIEGHDKNSTTYWQQILYTAILEPGDNTVIIAIDHIRHGGKGRPKMPVDLAAITQLNIKIHNTPAKPAYIDNLRLEKETRLRGLVFDGLKAFDVGTADSPVMNSFTQLDPSMQYTKERGFGFKDATIYGPAATKGAMDGFHPDPLYRDWANVEKGDLLVDLPNGKYQVFMNIDCPSGYWGEFQFYRTRKVLAQGKVVVDETMDFAKLKDRYFRHYGEEDLPTDDVFAKYVAPMFSEKTFDVEVTDGQLKLSFDSQRMGCALSALVVYPAEKAEQGRKFLGGVQALRKWHFSNDGKRVLHTPTGSPAPAERDRTEQFTLFQRDINLDVSDNDRPVLAPADAAEGQPPLPDTPIRSLAAAALPGQSLPITFCLLPAADLGKVKLSVTDLAGPDGKSIPASAIETGYVRSRLTRKSVDGTFYTIAPRWVIPGDSVDALANITRRFWLRVNVPKDTPAGIFKGTLSLSYGQNKRDIPVELRILHGSLDEADVPVGPFGHTINLPWFADDPAAAAWNEKMAAVSMNKIRQCGFTAFTGIPAITYKGFDPATKKPLFDFTAGDKQMEMARQAGFSMPFISYAPFSGLNLYFQDTDAMKKAGFIDYSEFVKTIFTEVQKHAEEKQWIPRYWGLGDEPAGPDAPRAMENMLAYRKAFPQGPPWFTFCGSYTEASTDDPHFLFAKAAHVAAWNLHSETSVRNLQKAGGQWAFYNGGNRWTFGLYMYKCVKQFDMKFRPSWHWNINAGDPYYPLDCREDDYAWCNATPDGKLISAVHFERLREGLTDYRIMLTLARLAKDKASTPAAAQAQKLIDERLGAFKLGQRDHDELFGVSDYEQFRAKMLNLIDKLAT